jgi:hypothetical protein
MKRGRKSKLNPQLQRALCNALALPTTIRSACEANGLSEKTYFEWLDRGEKGEQPFSQFREAVARARGRAKIKIVRSICDGKDERVKLELLARVFPAEYGRTEPREIVQQVAVVTPQPTAAAQTQTATEKWLLVEGDHLPLGTDALQYLDYLRAQHEGTTTSSTGSNERRDGQS